MTPELKQAGIAILNYAYQVCAEYEVPRDELPELFTQLRDAITIGQLPEKPPKPEPPPNTSRVSAEDHDRMFELHEQGIGYGTIANMLNRPKSTVAEHLNGTTPRPTASLPEPRSVPDSLGS